MVLLVLGVTKAALCFALRNSSFARVAKFRFSETLGNQSSALVRRASAQLQNSSFARVRASPLVLELKLELSYAELPL